MVDDDARVRDDFRRLLELEPDIDVVGGINDGATAIEFCDRTNPHVMVTDVRMPVMNGIDATRALRTSAQPTERQVRFAAAVATADRPRAGRC